MISEAKNEDRRQVRAEGMVITVKRCGSMKRQSISMTGREGARSWRDPGLPRDLSSTLKKLEESEEPMDKSEEDIDL